MNEILREDAIQIITENQGLQELKNSTFFITGASGMVGSYFVNTLITLNEMYNMNIKIIAVVRNPLKLNDYVINNPNVILVNQDVINPFNIEFDIDYIIHAASPASPKIMSKCPFETNIANTIGTYNTLKLGLEKKVKGYLFVSSREIYGQPTINQAMFYEDGELGQVNPLIPRNGYAEGKKAAENMCSSVKTEFGLNTKIARLAHTYGPGMSIDDGRVQADFLNNVIHNEDIIMKSKGESVRTYTYISDVISAMFKILLKSNDIVYNIADENSKTTIKELAQILVKISNNKSKLVMKIPDFDENQSGIASFTIGILSTDKLRNELNWKPKYSIEKGFERTINYLKSEYNLDENSKQKIR